ncbi:aldose epimerase [Dyella sp. 2HG41-7]|uniref:aldose 1-epimerase n=1 Tax=Dyella sp. 2HG41-7 TaxID=2883239 RepID=UPI001F3E0943
MHDTTPPRDSAQNPLEPGPIIRIAHGALAVDIAPAAGGRIAQITFDQHAWLIGHSAGHEAMIAWGSYPMLPWAGRIRHGRFRFQGHDYRLPINLGDHAIHGVALDASWHVDARSHTSVALSLQLPEDERWPFGGIARQLIEVGERRLRMVLTLSAGKHAMPATIGWHPWFRKPDRIDFAPDYVYPRDAEGIATLPLAPPPAGPWDDCFLNTKPVMLYRNGQQVRLTSDCDHWVVYDETSHATCVEPQSGPPDAFNLVPSATIAAAESLSAWFLMEW